MPLLKDEILRIACEIDESLVFSDEKDDEEKPRPYSGYIRMPLDAWKFQKGAAQAVVEEYLDESPEEDEENKVAVPLVRDRAPSGQGDRHEYMQQYYRTHRQQENARAREYQKSPEWKEYKREWQRRQRALRPT